MDMKKLQVCGKESCVVKLTNMCGQANIEMDLFKFFKK